VTRGWLLSAREGRQRQPSEERQRATRACGNRRAQRPAHRITCAHLRRPMRPDPVLCPCRVPSHPTRIPFGSIACVLPLPMCATHVCHGIASDAPRGAGRTDAPGGTRRAAQVAITGDARCRLLIDSTLDFCTKNGTPPRTTLGPPCDPLRNARRRATGRTQRVPGTRVAGGVRAELLALLGRPGQ